LIEVKVIVELVVPPFTTLTEVGLADIEKSGCGAEPQLANLSDPMCVDQLKVPLVFSYSVENQNVQSSLGSIRSAA
jgi:hypothetical protein